MAVAAAVAAGVAGAAGPAAATSGSQPGGAQPYGFAVIGDIPYAAIGMRT